MKTRSRYWRAARQWRQESMIRIDGWGRHRASEAGVHDGATGAEVEVGWAKRASSRWTIRLSAVSGGHR